MRSSPVVGKSRTACSMGFRRDHRRRTIARGPVRVFAMKLQSTSKIGKRISIFSSPRSVFRQSAAFFGADCPVRIDPSDHPTPPGLGGGGVGGRGLARLRSAIQGESLDNRLQHFHADRSHCIRHKLRLYLLRKAKKEVILVFHSFVNY